MVQLSKKQARSGKGLRSLLLLFLAGTSLAAFFLFFEGKKPTIDLAQIPSFLPKSGKLAIALADTGSGLREVTITMSQRGNDKELLVKEYPRQGYYGQVGPPEDDLEVAFDTKELDLQEGEVQLTVAVRDYSLRGMLAGNLTSATVATTIDSRPPTIRILHSEQYISPGGVGIAIYQVDDQESLHGVFLNGHFNRGFPVGDGRDSTYIAYFGVPFDAEKLTETRVVATDKAGNQATAGFATNFKPVRFKHDRINISDSFLASKIPEFEQHYPELSGTPLEKYLQVNSTIRQRNNQTIAELCGSPHDERLWQGPFRRMAGASPASFADHRTYYYQGEPIDKQVHLGKDLASTQQADVKAANGGRVVFADYLGIYGNMVLIDHGQGVFSLYSHLSQIATSVGTPVAGGDVIGLTGTTGMAGGDHLHFSMLVNGLFVTPLEWWDPNWIAVTIDEPLMSSKFQ